MADGSAQNGTDLISTDVITTLNGGAIATGEKAQRMKVGFGPDSFLQDVDDTHPLPVEVAHNSPNSAVAAVGWSVTVVTLQAANTARKGLAVYNATNVALYVKLGAAASTASFTVKIGADGYYEVPFNYTGIVTGIWLAGGTGSALVTEIT